MFAAIQTNNPDGGTIPVIVDNSDGGLSISHFTLTRSTGQGQGFEAEAYFNTKNVDVKSSADYLVFVHVHVLTEGWDAQMTDTTIIPSLDKLEPWWDFATPSQGQGPIHAVFIKTSVQEHGA